MSAESAGFTPPTAFGPFRVLHQIGSGVLGPVFRTYDPQNDRLVAVKAFRLEIVPEDVARLADSLRRLPSTGLSHAAIVRPLEAGLEGMSPFLAMEYVSAETLDVALRHLAPAPLDRAVPIIAEIAEALEAAWAAGVGHGSLHPRDVFIASGTNDVRITGFGTGQALEAAGIKVPPRRPYTAPERSTGGSWDIRADVYSLGAIAHELLTKRRPGSAGEQDGSLVTGTTPEQRRLIRGVLGAALAEAPEHRFHSPRAFANAMAAIARGESVGPLPEAPAAAAAADRPEAPPPPKLDPNATQPIARRGRPPAAKPTPLFAAADEARVEAPQPEPDPQSKPETKPAETVEPAALAAPPPPPASSSVSAEPPVRKSPGVSPEPADHPPAPAPAAAPDAPVHRVHIQHVEPISVHDSPRGMFGHGPVTGSPLTSGSAHVDPPPAAPRFPWMAVAAAVFAALAVGSVGGYWAGLHRLWAPPEPSNVVAPTTAASPETSLGAQAPAAIPPGTDVPVPPASAPPPPVGDAAAALEVKPTLPKPASEAPVEIPAPMGRLSVRSATSAAAVKIDGRAHGPAPVTVRDLALGAHTVEVSRAGFITRTERITLTAADASRTVILDLQPQAPPQPAAVARAAAAVGSLYLDSRPSGARILLDGKDAGKTPLTLADVKIGPHALRFELSGYKALDTGVTIRAGQQERVTVTLEQALIALISWRAP